MQAISGVQAISAGNSHSLFLKTDGTVQAAGNNDYGQLGDGTSSNVVAPIKVSDSAPDIGVEIPTDVPVANGAAALEFGRAVPSGSGISKTVVIRNMSNASPLGGIVVSINGAQASDFTIVSQPASSLALNGLTSFDVRFTPTAGGYRQATLSIASNDPDENPFTVTLSGTALTIAEDWRNQYFQQTNNTGTAADNADPDKDGISNLLERAFNLNPNQAALPILIPGTGTTGLPNIRLLDGPGGPVFSIQYLRRKASGNPGLVYMPQLTSDLTTTWQDFTGTETVESIDTVWERVTVEESATGQTMRFGRVKVVTVP